MSTIYKWLAGWYATRLHAIAEDLAPLDRWHARQAICGAWVYGAPRTEWAARRIAKGIPRCKRCERMAKQEKAE